MGMYEAAQKTVSKLLIKKSNGFNHIKKLRTNTPRMENFISYANRRVAMHQMLSQHQDDVFAHKAVVYKVKDTIFTFCRKSSLSKRQLSTERNKTRKTIVSATYVDEPFYYLIPDSFFYLRQTTFCRLPFTPFRIFFRLLVDSGYTVFHHV